MKIIELLNKIAKGEKVPKKIKYENDIYILLDNYCYFCEETNEILSQNIYAEFSRLNDEVEIIEDTPKISKLYINNKLQYDLAPKEDKKIGNLSILTFSDLLDMPKEELVDVIKEQRFKINEIIDYLNKEREQ